MKWRNRILPDFASIRDAYIEVQDEMDTKGYTPECSSRMFWINSQFAERIIDLTRNID